MTSLGNGQFVSVWTSRSASGSDIRGQIFNADGSKSGGELLINTTTEGSQYLPVVTALADGRFVVCWDDNSHKEDTSSLGIRARIFNADGSAAGNDFQVNLSVREDTQSQPTITALANGGFAVTFTSHGDTTSSDIYTRAYDRNGNPVGPDQIVNVQTAGSQNFSETVALDDGRYIVFYEDGDAISGRVFNANGTPASTTEFKLSSDGAEMWTGYPSATVLQDGRIAVTWNFAEDSNSAGIKARILNPDGTPSGPEIATHLPTSGHYYKPQVAALADGGFAIACFKVDQDTDFCSIIVTTFDRNGQRTGNDTVVEAEGRKIEFGNSLDLKALPDGRLVVSWDEEFGSNPTAIRAQILDPRGAGVTVAGSERNDEFYGTSFRDKLDGGAGNDKLWGGDSNDLLNGGAGRDVFVFDSKLGTHRTDRKVNFDKIKGFKAKDDAIWLDNAIFKNKALIKFTTTASEDSPKKLAKKFFKVGTKAKDKNDYFVYNKKKGVLMYDVDGSGSKKAIEFAQLDKNTKFSHKDLFFI